MQIKAPRRVALLALAVALAAAVASTTAFARPSHSASVQAASPACKKAGLGIATILSGPAASLGLDQLHWAQVFVSYWNSKKAIVGLPKGFKRTPIKLANVGDSQL